MTLTTGTPWYIDPAQQPAPRWTYGLRLGRSWYDALGTGLPWVPYGSMTLTRTSATTWRATFAQPLHDDPPLRQPACYVFLPSLVVEQVIPATDVNGRVTSVHIQTAEQGPYTYTLTVYGTRRVM